MRIANKLFGAGAIFMAALLLAASFPRPAAMQVAQWSIQELSFTGSQTHGWRELPLQATATH